MSSATSARLCDALRLPQLPHAPHWRVPPTTFRVEDLGGYKAVIHHVCVCKQLRDLMIYTPIQWQFIHNFSWEVKSMMYFKPFLTQYACRTNFIKFLCSAPSVSNIFKLEDWNTWSSETHSRNADQCRQPASHAWLAVSIGGFIRFPKMEVPPNHPSHDHFRNPGWPGWLGDPPF